MKPVHSVKKVICLSAVSLITAATATAFANHEFTPTAGGTGGAPFYDYCSTAGGSFLTGFHLKSGGYVDNINGICDSNGWLPPHGGSGGPVETIQSCPSGYVVFGLTGKAGGYVDQLTTVCVNRSNASQSWTWPGHAGGTGGRAYSISCFPQDGIFTAAIGLFGRAGGYVDQIGLICDRM